MMVKPTDTSGEALVGIAPQETDFYGVFTTLRYSAGCYRGAVHNLFAWLQFRHKAQKNKRKKKKKGRKKNE